MPPGDDRRWAVRVALVGDVAPRFGEAVRLVHRWRVREAAEQAHQAARSRPPIAPERAGHTLH